MVNEEIIKSISQTSEKIKEDKARLLNIVNAINSGVTDDKVNEKLIDNLAKLEYEDENVSDAMEYVSIILSNMRTQKLNQKKGTIDELLKTLEYNLTILRNLEHSVILFNKDIQGYINKMKDNDSKFTHSKKNKDKGSKKSLIAYLAPKGTIDSILMWLIGLIITVFIIHEIDARALKEVHDLSTDATAIASKPNNEVHLNLITKEGSDE